MFTTASSWWYNTNSRNVGLPGQGFKVLVAHQGWLDNLKDSRGNTVKAVILLTRYHAGMDHSSRPDSPGNRAFADKTGGRSRDAR